MRRHRRKARWLHPVFLPVELVDPAHAEAVQPILPNTVLPNTVLPDCLLEIETVGGHRLRVSGSYDPEALVRLIQGLSG